MIKKLPKVLLAEDTPDLLDHFIYVLAPFVDLDAAAGGEAALLLLEAMAERGARYDLLLLDVAMPIKCGWDVAERAKELDPDVPIVFLTAHGSTEMKGLASRLDIAHVEPKPVAPERLRELVITFGRQN